MEHELEIELKNLVTEDEFTLLVDHFSIHSDQFNVQTNHYFDTKQFALKQSGCALRIREKGNRFTFTLKEPKGDGLLETNETVESTVVRRLIDGNMQYSSKLANYLRETHNIDFQQLLHLGSLQTSRYEQSYRSGLLVFDHSSYLGVEDFELEFEVPDRKQGEIEFAELLRKFDIPSRTTPNKIQRFFDVKNRSE